MGGGAGREVAIFFFQPRFLIMQKVYFRENYISYEMHLDESSGIGKKR